MKNRGLLPHLGVALAAFAMPALVQADTLTLASDGVGGQGFTVKTQILVLMTLLGLLPALLMTMTSFLRYVIVLSLVKLPLFKATVIVESSLVTTLPNRSSTATSAGLRGVPVEPFRG